MIRLKCPECGSMQILTRIKSKTRYCRRCGHEWTFEPKKPVIAIVALLLCLIAGNAWAYTTDEIVNAIYKAEGGAKTNHPYGIMTKYRHTTPRQACANTVNHALKDYKGQPDDNFIRFLQKRYAPLNVANDPMGLNRFWTNNVLFFLHKGA